MPETLTYLGGMAFWGASNLIEIWIPEGIEILGDYTFVNCSKLEHIYLPSTLQTIGNYAINYTVNLKAIIIQSVEPPTLLSSILDVSNGYYQIFIPSESWDSYVNSAWSKYQSFFHAYHEVTVTYMIQNHIFKEDVRMNYQPYELLTLDNQDGYELIGWYDNAEFNGDPISELSYPLETDTILYGKVSSKEYMLELWIETSGFKYISYGKDYALAVTNNQHVYQWGKLIGSNSIVDQDEPLDLSPYLMLADDELIIQILTGENHALIITSRGRVFSWGYNDYGQLGNGSYSNSLIPIEITREFNLSSDEYVIQGDLGAFHSLVMTNQGRVFAFGKNHFGYPNILKSNVPLEISSLLSYLDNESTLMVSAGRLNTFILTTSGRLFGTGNNFYKQLHIELKDEETSFVELTDNFTLATDEILVKIISNQDHMFAITSQHRIFAWGKNTQGQLGIGNIEQILLPRDITPQFDLISGETIVSINAGYNHSGAITSEGRIFLWGSNYYDQLGITEPYYTIPYDISPNLSYDLAQPWIHITVNDKSTLIYSSNLDYYYLGSGSYDISGIGYITPTHMLYDKTVISFGTFSDRELPTMKGYIFYGWYDDINLINLYKELTYPTTTVLLYGTWERNLNQTYNVTYVLNDGVNHPDNPEEYYSSDHFIKLLPAEKVDFIFLGWYDNPECTGNPITYLYGGFHQSFTLYACFEERLYTLSFETTEDISIDSIQYAANDEITELPVPIREGYEFKGWFLDELLEKPFDLTHMPREDLTLYAKWQIESYEVFYINIKDQIKVVVAGSYHTFYLTESNRLLVAGQGYYGKLGIGITTDQRVFIDITNQFNLTDDEFITNVYAGMNHSIVLTSLGRIFTFGSNSYGQLGNGLTTHAYTPYDITSQFVLNDQETIIHITTDFDQSFLLTSQGRVFAWGANNYGQLGIGSTTNSNIPIDITSFIPLDLGEQVILIETGAYHTMVVTNFNRIFGWGYNSDGRLGDGTFVHQKSPVLVAPSLILNENENITSLSLGGSFQFIMTSNHNIYAWGMNNYGYLGIGTNVNKLSPVLINPYFNLYENEIVIKINASVRTTIAVTSMGRVFSWGHNYRGQSGTGGQVQVWRPFDMTQNMSLLEGERIILADTGGYSGDGHSIIATNIMRIFTCGHNLYGQLSIDSTTNQFLPTLAIINSTGAIISIETYDYGSIISPLTPTEEGLVFVGWYDSPEFTNLYDFNALITSNQTIYGKWIKE